MGEIIDRLSKIFRYFTKINVTKIDHVRIKPYLLERMTKEVQSYVNPGTLGPTVCKGHTILLGIAFVPDETVPEIPGYLIIRRGEDQTDEANRCEEGCNRISG